MKRLTSWFDEASIWPTHNEVEAFLNWSLIQAGIIIGMWVVAAVDYSAAISLSHLRRPRINHLKLSVNEI